jgi:DNA invertase Pin-like site-specific DNA recombinase
MRCWMRASDLTRLMAVLAKGDVLVITRFDRLARSTRDLLNLLGTIAEKGAGPHFSERDFLCALLSVNFAASSLRLKRHSEGYSD